MPRRGPPPCPSGATKSASDRFGLRVRLGFLLAQHAESERFPVAARDRRRRRCRRRWRWPARSHRPRGRSAPRPTPAGRATAARDRRATSPRHRTADARRSSGSLPFSSHALKKNVQSMYGRSCATDSVGLSAARERGRRQRFGGPVDPQAVLTRLAQRQQRLLLPLLVHLADSRLFLADLRDVGRRLASARARSTPPPRPATRRARARRCPSTPARSSRRCAADWSWRRR